MPKFPDDFLPHNPEDGPPVPRFLPKWPATRDDIEMAVERLELLYIRETARGSKVRVYKKNHKQAIIEVFDVDDMNSLVSLLWATNTRYKLTQYPGVGYRLEFDLDVLETIMSTMRDKLFLKLLPGGS